MSDSKLRKGRIEIVPGRPIKIPEDEFGEPLNKANSEHLFANSRIGATIKAYLVAANDLLEKQYAHLKHLAPSHLNQPVLAVVVHCTDGVLIRYDANDQGPKVLSIFLAASLAEVAGQFSEQMIICFRGAPPLPEEVKCSEIIMGVSSSDGQPKGEFVRFKIYQLVDLDSPLGELPAPPQKPYCVASILNSFEIELHGEMLDATQKPGAGQAFITRSRIRLNVGWEAIEVYIHLNLDNWMSEYAYGWAERDIMAALLMSQTHEATWKALDPKAGARKQYATLLSTYKALLDSNPDREETLQVFLKDHPELLCPARSQMWPKLHLGKKVTDFVFRDGVGAYLLVELERSTLELFKKDGHPNADVTHAIHQIVDWKRYLEDNLAYVQKELGLEGISTNPESLIVIGRSSSLNSETRRTLTTMSNQMPRLRIMTYDDVYDNAKAVIENLLGPLWEAGSSTEMIFPN